MDIDRYNLKVGYYYIAWIGEHSYLIRFDKLKNNQIRSKMWVSIDAPVHEIKTGEGSFDRVERHATIEECREYGFIKEGKVFPYNEIAARINVLGLKQY